MRAELGGGLFPFLSLFSSAGKKESPVGRCQGEAAPPPFARARHDEGRFSLLAATLSSASRSASDN